VMDVHDLHVWTITSGRDALSAHVVVDQNANSDRVLTEITHIVQHDFELHHSTLQIEQAECKSLDGICIDTAAGES
jgi:cobalt-zinc-cadmium efflux system protein